MPGLRLRRLHHQPHRLDPHRGRRAGRGLRAPAVVLRAPLDGAPGGAGRAVARLAALPRAARHRGVPDRRPRRDQLRLLRPHPQRHPRAAGALEARRRAGRGCAGRGGRSGVRRAALPAALEADDGRPGRPPARGLPGLDLAPGLDDRGDQGARLREARDLPAQDRLPRDVPRLLGAPGLPGRPDGQRRRRLGLRDRPPGRQDRLAGRPRRVVHAAADRQRLLQPRHQRDLLPRRHPAGPVLRPRRAPGRELRRHRRGHRPRDRPRLRRPGRAVRRRRATSTTGGPPTTRPPSR